MTSIRQSLKASCGCRKRNCALIEPGETVIRELKGSYENEPEALSGAFRERLRDPWLILEAARVGCEQESRLPELRSHQRPEVTALGIARLVRSQLTDGKWCSVALTPRQ